MLASSRSSSPKHTATPVSSVPLCLAFTSNFHYEEFVLLSRTKLQAVMDLFDSMFPDALKSQTVFEDGEIYHDRCVGERFCIIFCFDEDWERVGFSNVRPRSWVHRCLNRISDDGVTMHYLTACRLMFRDLRVLVRLERKHNARRRLALAMALHPRLGRASGLLAMPPDVMQMIAYANYMTKG